jgi:hypothetical protein
VLFFPDGVIGIPGQCVRGMRWLRARLGKSGRVGERGREGEVKNVKTPVSRTAL